MNSKRKAVTTLLKDEEWNAWSNEKVAGQCNVSSHFVGVLRKELQSHSDSVIVTPQPRTFTTKHGTTATMMR